MESFYDEFKALLEEIIRKNVKKEIIEELLEAMTFLRQYKEKIEATEYEQIKTFLYELASKCKENQIEVSCIILNFLMWEEKDKNACVCLLKLVIESKQLILYNKYYLWRQLSRNSFIFPEVFNEESIKLHKQLYQDIYWEYYKRLHKFLNPILKEERKADYIVVFTNQFLGERHAPTKTVLERCYILGKILKKQILLINTREQCTELGELPLYMAWKANIDKRYNKVGKIIYKDYKIPFYQYNIEMPQISRILETIQMIKEIKPAFIFNIGGGSIVADICGVLVPELTTGVVFSALPTTMGTFSLIGRKLSDIEWSRLLEEGYQREQIIEAKFTFELKKQEAKFTREEFQIPEDKFILVVVGNRLESEILDDFLQMLIESFKWNTYVVFAGEFENYDKYCEKYQKLKENSSFIGYCNDILALMELCDLYINPRRLGGGFSVIEAFYKGVPGVSIQLGDVAIAAGSEFCVEDYETMLTAIKRYIEDKEFYNRMAKKAKERAIEMTNSVQAMQDILDKLEKNSLYQ